MLQISCSTVLNYLPAQMPDHPCGLPHIVCRNPIARLLCCFPDGETYIRHSFQQCVDRWRRSEIRVEYRVSPATNKVSSHGTVGRRTGIVFSSDDGPGIAKIQFQRIVHVYDAVVKQVGYIREAATARSVSINPNLRVGQRQRL